MTIPAISQAQVPAHIQARMGQSRLADSVGGGIGATIDYPRISVRGGRFRIIEDGQEFTLNTLELPVVIVGANPRLTKMFYADRYNPDAQGGAPDCFSMDGQYPDSTASRPQHTTCATCPRNAWVKQTRDDGSVVEGKECQDTKRLAVIAAGQPEAKVHLLSVTPSALKNINLYQKELVQHGLSPEFVITRVGMNTDRGFPQLTFAYHGMVDEATLAQVDALIDSDKVKEVCGLLNKPLEIMDAGTTLPVPAAQPAPALPPVPERPMQVPDVRLDHPIETKHLAGAFPSPAPQPIPPLTGGWPVAAQPAPQPAPPPLQSGFAQPAPQAAPAPDPWPAPAPAPAPVQAPPAPAPAPVQEPPADPAQVAQEAIGDDGIPDDMFPQPAPQTAPQPAPPPESGRDLLGEVSAMLGGQTDD